MDNVEREMTSNADDRTTHHDDHNKNLDESGKMLSAIIALLGLWMIFEAFLLDIVVTQFWNDIFVGVLLLAVGGYNYLRQSDEEFGSAAAASVAAVLGLWLIAAAFVLGAGVEPVTAETLNDIAFWNDIVVGLIAFATGAYSAYTIREERERRTVRRTAT